MAAFPTVSLASGSQMPMLAYGTGTYWFKRGDEREEVIDRKIVDGVKDALEVGFRHLDGSEMYKTEPELGLGISESGVPRSEIFLTTKVVGLDDVEASLQSSLAKLRTEYVDLYLIHKSFSATSKAQLQSAWKKMESCVRRGLAKNIGMANCRESDLQTVLEVAEIKPSVAQIEVHPFLKQKELLATLRKQDIVVEAYGSLSPLTKANYQPLAEVLASLSQKYAVSESAVLLRWVIDQGIVAITTSGNGQRLRSYVEDVPAFKLDVRDMEEITRVCSDRHFRGFFAKELDG